MRVFVRLILALCLLSPALRLQPAIYAAPLQAQPVIQCTGNFATPGCQSFQDMVKSGDEDILKSIQGSHAFVCFRSEVDVFIVLSYTEPAPESFLKKPGKYQVVSPGFITVDTYKGGVQDDWHIFVGEWVAADKDSIKSAYFSSTAKDQSASAGSSELGVSFSFANLSGGETTRTIKVRRSTLRLVESMQGTGKDKDGKQTTFSYDFSGHCVEYK